MDENQSVAPSPLAPHPHKEFFIIGSIFTLVVLIFTSGLLYFGDLNQNSKPVFGYTKDSAHVYFNGEVVSIADPATFVVLGTLYGEMTGDADSWGGEYAKDKNHVYFGSDKSNIVNNAVSNTFMFVDPAGKSCGIDCLYDAQDEYYKYYQGKIVATTDARVPEVIGTLNYILDPQGNKSGFVKDAEHIYFAYPTGAVTGIAAPDSGKVAYKQEVDYETFEVVGLNGIYVKDKNYVYYSTDSSFSVIVGSDPLTFVASSTNIWAAEDKNHQYLNGKIVE
jgi:hypothetical protein